MSFKRNLKIELFYNGMTLKELAGKVGVSYGTMVNYTSSRELLPNIEKGYEIAKALGKSVEYLCTGEEPNLKNSHSAIYPYIKELLSLPKNEVSMITDLIHELYTIRYLK